MRLTYPLTARQHEPNFEVTEIRVFGAAEPIAHLHRCLHANVVPVESCGELLAYLCIDCDAQLPEEARLA